MLNHRTILMCVIWTVVDCTASASELTVLLKGLRHLRAHEPREWSDFPASPDGREIDVTFDWDLAGPPRTLRWRQQDVKQNWRILLNDVELGRLMIDENDQVRYVDIPSNTIRAAGNHLRVEQQGTAPDDIRVGELTLDKRPLSGVLGESRLTVTVTDQSTGIATPCRITLINSDGALQTVAPFGTAPAEHLAIRAGVVYTANGTADLSLPAGKYTVLAGRGVEYSLATRSVNCLADQTTTAAELMIRRVVPTPGYVACDPHIHTLTFSGHGDATALERVVTIAGEGIELPIATDHNVHVDLQPLAIQAHVRQHFTPVVGNEVTTRTGHFNVFPVDLRAAPRDHRQLNWEHTLDGIFATPNVRVAILNHARERQIYVR